jgi:hypothetical protein
MYVRKMRKIVLSLKDTIPTPYLVRVLLTVTRYFSFTIFEGLQ